MVRWSIRWGGWPIRTSVKGQAALVDLGNKGIVAATLTNGEDYGPAKDGAHGALWVATEALEITALRARYRAYLSYAEALSGAV
jgi:hypothetical protein